MNDWFRRHAKANQVSGISRPTVFIAGDSGRIVGYVTLVAGQTKREHLPKAARRNRPGAFPFILVGQLAVD